MSEPVRPFDERDRAAQRDSAYERDRVAAERDRVADARDRVADERDETADERDRVDGLSVSQHVRTVADREAAARDRAEGSRDRGRAAYDRRQAACDRDSAGFDGLTGALQRDRGRVVLQLETDRARRSDGQLVLAFIDVDGLKAINDALGHAAGDEVLRNVGAALRTSLRSYDLVIRHGGDEFVCALSGIDVESAQQRLDNAARALTERNPRASVSIGLAALDKEETLDELTARADAALYAGRGRLFRRARACRSGTARSRSTD
jgi:diguanylate cyclase (GGDEF)-like protein